MRKRFVFEGFEAVLKPRRPHRIYSRKLDGEQEAHLIALVCGTPPEGYARWSLRLLAERVVQLKIVESVSHETIRHVLARNELKPWRKQEWCIPPRANAEFVYHMEDVLDVYKRPVNPQHPLVCFDETPEQLISETRQALPMQGGQPQRYWAEFRYVVVNDDFAQALDEMTAIVRGRGEPLRSTRPGLVAFAAGLLG